MESAAAEEGGSAFVGGSSAVLACAVMASCYVAILYAPTVILRLPPAISLESYMIRRFLCALTATAASLVFSATLLGVWRLEDFEAVLSIYGLRKDHMWQAVAFPLFLTSLPYTGSLVLGIFLLIGGWEEVKLNSCFPEFVGRIRELTYNTTAWRNYVVAPFTEELVFRACMIPLLLCGGYRTYIIIFFSPVFFSLGVQLGYTIIFGWYASFLFMRTGNLISPIVAHIFCNFMGLPVLSSSQTKGATTIAFAAGLVCFFWLLFPASSPDLYNERTDVCLCWHSYCNWS